MRECRAVRQVPPAGSHHGPAPACRSYLFVADHEPSYVSAHSITSKSPEITPDERNLPLKEFRGGGLGGAFGGGREPRRSEIRTAIQAMNLTSKADPRPAGRTIGHLNSLPR